MIKVQTLHLLQMGLINRITEQEKLLDETMKIAEELARLPMEPLKQTKKLMNGHIRGRLDEILRAEQEAVVAVWYNRVFTYSKM